MMIRNLIFVLVLLASSPIFAQNVVIFGPRHASTVGEGYLNGRARLNIGRGYFLRSNGQFLINREEALRMRIDNYERYVRMRWRVWDDYKEWRHGNRKTYIDRQNQRLDIYEKTQLLNKRRASLGLVLPDKKVGFNGKYYDNVKDLRSSPDYLAFKEELIKKREARRRD